MATFIRFLKKKSNKDQADLSRDKPGRSSVRNRPTTFAEPESTEWAAKSPYDVVTAPKTAKATRSCPGAPIGGSSRAASSKRQVPHHTFANSRQSSFSERYKNVPVLEEITNRRPPRPRPGSSSEYGSMRGYAPSSRFEPTLQRTSEYGSADPSPTNPYGYAESSDSEYSDLDVVSSQMLRYYDKQIHKLRSKCRHYKDLAIRYKQGYEDEHRTAQQLSRRVDKEVEARMRLSAELKHAKVENDHLRSALAARCSSFMPEQQTGAGEAMCSRSDLSAMAHHTELAPLPALSLNYDTESDEVKCFRGREDDSVPEQPRSAPVGQGLFSPDSVLRGAATATLKDVTPMKTDDDGYSTMNLNAADAVHASKPAGDVLLRPDAMLDVHEVVELGALDCEPAEPLRSYKETHFHDLVAEDAVRIRNPSPVDEASADESPSPRGLRRSFSDSDVRNLEVVYQPREESPGAPKPNKDWADPAHFFPYSKKRRSRAYAKQVDNSSSFSSDDENARILSRQLHKRGDLVQFRPPRKSVVVMKSNIYRRFGPNERSALSQFEYLQDMTTDVSGLLSSPDRSPGSF